MVEGRRALHWAYASTLLNDLFGIQARGGCMCAGPMALALFGLDGDTERALEQRLIAQEELLRPGFVRVAFPYHMPLRVALFIARALRWVADHGAHLLPLYTPVPDTGEFRHKSYALGRQRPRLWLHDVTFASGAMRVQPRGNAPRPSIDAAERHDLSDALIDAYFTAADALLASLRLAPPAPALAVPLSPAGEAMRWFLLPGDPLHRPEDAEDAGDAKTVPEHAGKDVGGRDAVNAGEAGEARDAGDGDEDEEEGGSAFLAGMRLGADEDDDEDGKSGSGAAAASKEDNEDDDNDHPLAHPLAHQKRRREVAYRFPEPPGRLLEEVRRAIGEYHMIVAGDRVMVGLSGGKDSLSMLHVLGYLQQEGKTRFELRACTVDPMSPAFDPRPLRAYVERLGVAYTLESAPVIPMAEEKGASLESLCAWCARMKRGMLYTACRREGCNVLALGQHLDDLSESLMMSLMHNGLLRTMKAHYLNGQGDVRIVRPLCLVRERQMRAMAAERALPVIDENCPACFDAPTERARAKVLLRAQEGLFPNLFRSLLKAMRPLMVDRSWQDLCLARGRAFPQDPAPVRLALVRKVNFRFFSDDRHDRHAAARRDLGDVRRRIDDWTRAAHGTPLADLTPQRRDQIILDCPAVQADLCTVPGVDPVQVADSVFGMAVAAGLSRDALAHLAHLASQGGMRLASFVRSGPRAPTMPIGFAAAADDDRDDD
jgi:tRNA(Ile)-lysidine synthase TilS/MesJ